jgi:hypothetical protein
MNYEYFMSKDLHRYTGDWVIIAKKKMVAHGPRARMKAMLQQAKKDYPKESLFIAKVQ